jgi:arsenate reductase (thioredoxin)
MRRLAAIAAALVFVCGPSASEDNAQRQVVFVCEHGSVKSLMAASYFNQLAEQRQLPCHAISRGSAPDSTTVPKPIAAGLQADGVDVSDFRPARIRAVEAAQAARIVAIGTELPIDVRAGEPRVERWDDVPPASTDYAAARAALKAHIADLIRRLEQASESSP